jgi:ribonuclease J
VITPSDAPIHVSGHGSQEELKLMLNLTRPRQVFPFHGDHKRIRLHAELAEAVGIEPDRIHRGRNGLPLEIDGDRARFGDDLHTGMIFVDGVDIGDPDDVALRDRRMLSADGIFIVVATISSDDGASVAPPEIIFRGVPFLDDAEADGIVDELREVVVASLGRAAHDGVREPVLLQQDLHDDIAGFVYDRLRRRPMVLPVVVEV